MATVLLAVVVVAATRSPRSRRTSDNGKIADALRAGPDFITRNATILDWPSSPGGTYRVLREGTSEWTCLPGLPGYKHGEPGCFDRVCMPYVAHLPQGTDFYLVMPK